MARPAKYSTDQILDSASRLLQTNGLAGLNVADIAKDLGAPSGSIYHRFGSRDVLVASLWLRSIDRFHHAMAPALESPTGRNAIRALALGIVTWARANPLDAQLLLLHRSSDLLNVGWPAELAERNLAQRARVQEMVDTLSRRLGVTTAEQRRRVAFAAIEIPQAAVRGYLSRGESPLEETESLVTDAVEGVLDGLQPSIKELL